MRSHVTWTHGATHQMRLAAVAGSIALLCGTQDTSSLRESQDGLEQSHRLVWFVAQVRVHWRRVGDLARVKNSGRIPRSFDLAKKGIVLIADHQRQKLAAKPSVAVLAAE